MRDGNAPDVSVRVVVVKRQDHSATCRVQVFTKTGDWATAYTSHWPTGRPTPRQWELVIAQLDYAATQAVRESVGFVGVA